MLNLFLRTVLLYGFLLLILRLTGKRQVADLEPSDLIVTLVIADVGSNAIGDPNIPLLYSVVPIVALYLVQQGIAWVCLKSDRLRGIVCGTPQYLIRGGVLQRTVMRRTNYAIRDLVEHLRQKDVFDLSEVEDAILESNGSLSVRLRHGGQPPSREELDLPDEREQPPELLVREGKVLPEGLQAAHLDERRLRTILQAHQLAPEDVFVAQRQTDGTIRIQTRDARIVTAKEG